MPSESPFDPCKQWLGIDAVDLGNPRIVLGISPRETDPRVVLQAAEARLSLLRRLSPGPFEMARAALLARVEEAREKLLAEIALVPSATRAAGGGPFAMPAPPSQRAGSPASQPPAPAGMPFAAPVSPPPAVPTTGQGVVPSVPPPVPMGGFHGDGGGTETITIRTTVYRKKTPVAGIAMTVLALAAVAGGLVYYTYFGRQKFRKSAERQAARVEPKAEAQARNQGKDSRPEPKPTRARTDARRKEPVSNDPTSDDAVSTSPPPSKQIERSRPSRPEPESSQESESVEFAIPDMQPEPPMRKPVESMPIAEESMAKESAEKTADDGPTPPVASASPASGRLDKTLTETLESLRRQEDDSVKRLLAEASKEAQGRQAKERVSGWQQLATYYKGFLGYREKALAAVKAGDEYDVKNQKIVVNEMNGDTFGYRAAGGNKTVPRDKIPAGIVLAIVMQWFDENPANDLYLGAYHLAKPESDRQRAREHWERAEAAGADASVLMPLLDDPVFSAAE